MASIQESSREGVHTLSEAYRILQEGSNRLIQGLNGQEFIRYTQTISQIRSISGFLETLHLIWDAMPEERLRETIRNSATSIRNAIQNLPRIELNRIPNIPIDSNTQLPEFLVDAFRFLGPHLQISPNEMKAWILIPSIEADLYDAASILENVRSRGVVYGVLADRIESMFAEQRFNVEELIAEGKKPTLGRAGRVEFTIPIYELSQVPKLQEDGSVSFKDIELFAFVSAGDVIARMIPPIPGEPGCTVTGREIQPPAAEVAKFPDCENTLISEDGLEMYAAIDGCISKKNGRIFLQPSLMVPGNVSYESGNIDSKVTVQVAKDVLTGFSVKTEHDLLVRGTVEGAQLEAQGEIVVKGGVQGKDKAVIEANGAVSARFISHAKVSSLSNVLAESAIMNSVVWSGQNVLVTGKNGEIVGGEIEADGDVVASTIGSEMEVKTVIRLGSRLDDLTTMIVENQEKMAEQEESLDKCLEIIQLFKSQIEKSPNPSAELLDAMQHAESMRDAARVNIEQLQAENDGLQMQYDECLKRSRMVRASTNIIPGVIIDIQGTELNITKPTGPATIVKQGDILAVLPYMEFDLKELMK